MGEKAYCLIGSKGTKLFYDNKLFIRNGAAPKRVEKTLFGENGVQSLDGKAHWNRKNMFMQLMNKKSMNDISTLVYKHWRSYFNNKAINTPINMYEASKYVFFKVACEWIGVPIKKAELNKRVSQLSDLFESPAAIGLKHWKGRSSRKNTNGWIEKIVQDIRGNNLRIDEEKALYKITWHRDINNKLLETKVVAVEILNLLRPMVAVSIWVANLGLGIHQFPQSAKELQNKDNKKIEMFIQEVRRYYPFFPFAVARVYRDFEYNGFKLKKGTLTLLDLHGTNKDPDSWTNPDHFMPKRFENWEQTPFNFIPQGGGSYDFGHRCAGEFVTMEMLKSTMDILVNEITYNVPKQNFDINLNSIPAIPKDGFIIEKDKIHTN